MYYSVTILYSSVMYIAEAEKSLNKSRPSFTSDDWELLEKRGGLFFLTLGMII